MKILHEEDNTSKDADKLTQSAHTWTFVPQNAAIWNILKFTRSLEYNLL
jgi:hypothetical protein